MIQVREIELDEKAKWNDFVFNHPKSTCFHLYEWKLAIEHAYDLSTCYLGAYRDGSLIGVLPAVVMKRPLGRKIAVSLAYCGYAGWLIDFTEDEREITAMYLHHLRQHGIRALELRSVTDTKSTESQEATLRLSLPNSSQDLWNRLDVKVRNQVRKAQKSRLTAHWGTHQLSEFYNVYASNMAHLGTPVHSRSFFEQICTHMTDRVDILTVKTGEQAIAAMLLVKFRHQLSDPWASSLRNFDPLCPNMLMYWEALKYGCIYGFKEFDFGRSQVSSGTFRFKFQWDPEIIPLKHTLISLEGDQRTDSITLYRSLSARLFSCIWKRIPFSITLKLGPKLRKYLP